MNSRTTTVGELNPGDKFRQFGGWIVYSAAPANDVGEVYVCNTHTGKLETLPPHTPVIVWESTSSD